jgi:hypothetical protein
MQPPHVLLALSAHGFGHLAQCAPVVNALWAEAPELRLSVCGALPQAVVAERLDRPFDYHCIELDPVLQMVNAWEVDVPASRRVYRAFHERWETGLQQDVDLLRQSRPDVVLADIPYRILSAAAQLDLAAIAMCSINWADIYAAYCNDDPEDRQIIAQMLEGYQAAQTFLTPRPAIPMAHLRNTRAIGPIARRGRRQKRALCAQLALPKDVKLVLVALGGIPTGLPLHLWPRIDNTVWLLAGTPCPPRDDFLDAGALALSFIDVLASADAVLTKPGYGTYAEAVCNGVPVLSIERPDWPETEVLNRWVHQHGHLEVMTREQFYTGTFTPLLQALLATDPGPGMPADGIGQAVGLIRSLLPSASHASSAGLSG